MNNDWLSEWDREWVWWENSVYDINVSYMEFLFDRVIKILIKSGCWYWNYIPYMDDWRHVIYCLVFLFFFLFLLFKIFQMIRYWLFFTTHKFMNASKSAKNLVWKFHRSRKKKNETDLAHKSAVLCVSFVELKLHIYENVWLASWPSSEKEFEVPLNLASEETKKEWLKQNEKKKLAWIWKIWRLN